MDLYSLEPPSTVVFHTPNSRRTKSAITGSDTLSMNSLGADMTTVLELSDQLLELNDDESVHVALSAPPSIQRNLNFPSTIIKHDRSPSSGSLLTTIDSPSRLPPISRKRYTHTHTQSFSLDTSASFQLHSDLRSLTRPPSPKHGSPRHSLHSRTPGTLTPDTLASLTPSILSRRLNSNRASLTNAFDIRSMILLNTDLLSTIFHFLEFHELIEIARTCRKWYTFICGSFSSIPFINQSQNSRYSVGMLKIPKELEMQLPKTQSRRQSLVDRVLGKFACSTPNSPKSRSRSRKGSLSESISASVNAPKPFSSKRNNYLLYRNSVTLTALPASKPALTALFTAISHVSEIKFSRHAEQQVTDEMIECFVECFGKDPAKPFTALTFCSCQDGYHPDQLGFLEPLLSPAFLGDRVENHSHYSLPYISEGQLALLFRLENCLSIFSSLKTLSLSNCGAVSDRTIPIFQNLRSLESISLSNCVQVTDDVIDQFLSVNPSVRKLDISNCIEVTSASCYYISVYCVKSLEWLSLANCKAIDDSGIIELANLSNLAFLNIKGLDMLSDYTGEKLAQCSKLTELDISSCPNITWRTLKALSLTCQLRTLDLSGCRAMDDRGLHYILSSRLTSKQGSILHLSLSGCPLITDNVTQQILSYASQLETLDISNCAALTDISCNSISMLPNLRSLNVSGCGALTDIGILSISGISTLNSLLINGCKLISNEGIYALCSIRPLRWLSLASLPLITDESVRAIVSSLRSLEFLSLSRCKRLNDLAIRHVTAYCTRLLELDISNLSDLKENTILSVFKMHSLKRVDMSGIDVITDSLFRRILTQSQFNQSPAKRLLLPNSFQDNEWSSSLSFCVFRDCNKISWCTVHELENAFPRCRFLYSPS